MTNTALPWEDMANSVNQTVSQMQWHFFPSLSKSNDGYSHFWVRTCILILSRSKKFSIDVASIKQFLNDNDVLSLLIWTEVESRSKRWLNMRLERMKLVRFVSQLTPPCFLWLAGYPQLFHGELGALGTVAKPSRAPQWVLNRLPRTNAGPWPRLFLWQHGKVCGARLLILWR